MVNRSPESERRVWANQQLSSPSVGPFQAPERKLRWNSSLLCFDIELQYLLYPTGVVREGTGG